MRLAPDSPGRPAAGPHGSRARRHRVHAAGRRPRGLAARARHRRRRHLRDGRGGGRGRSGRIAGGGPDHALPLRRQPEPLQDRRLARRLLNRRRPVVRLERGGSGHQLRHHTGAVRGRALHHRAGAEERRDGCRERGGRQARDRRLTAGRCGQSGRGGHGGGSGGALPRFALRQAAPAIRCRAPEAHPSRRGPVLPGLVPAGAVHSLRGRRRNDGAGPAGAGELLRRLRAPARAAATGGRGECHGRSRTPGAGPAVGHQPRADAACRAAAGLGGFPRRVDAHGPAGRRQGEPDVPRTARGGGYRLRAGSRVPPAACGQPDRRKRGDAAVRGGAGGGDPRRRGGGPRDPAARRSRTGAGEALRLRGLSPRTRAGAGPGLLPGVLGRHHAGSVRRRGAGGADQQGDRRGYRARGPSRRGPPRQGGGRPAAAVGAHGGPTRPTW